VALTAIVCAAALAPRRTGRPPEVSPRAEGAKELEALSARDLASAVADPLIIYDSAGAVLHANEAAQSAFGPLPRGLSLQMRFRAPEMQDLLANSLAGGEPPTPVDYSERQPHDRAYRVAATPIGTGGGLRALVFRDQSEARRTDRMRADFIANASHELRTPLASISGFIETLRGPARDDAAARENFLQIMQGQTERMARLIDDLLSLSRLEMRTFLRPSTPVDLNALLQQLQEALGQMASESGVTVEAHLPEGPVEVPANRDELYQVFQNLLENACKYGASGGRVEIMLEAHRRKEPPEVAVTIRDYGPGIAREHIPRITERFYRVDVETSRAQKGTGLGLAIVKHILTRHNARLSIQSEPAECASFTVHFPAFSERATGNHS
jgi:two-component system, OmpR family, phosphate regulon sensor histidine kinase PhoR